MNFSGFFSYNSFPKANDSRFKGNRKWIAAELATQQVHCCALSTFCNCSQELVMYSFYYFNIFIATNVTSIRNDKKSCTVKQLKL